MEITKMTYGGGDSGRAATSARLRFIAPRPASVRGEVCPQAGGTVQAGDTVQLVSPLFRTHKYPLGSPVLRPPV